MVKMICFDMDGTIADLYGVDNWLAKLRAEDASAYTEAVAMWDMEELNSVLRALQNKGIEIRVITWLSKDSSEEFKIATRKAKREWLEKVNFPFDKFHGVQYGATKADSVRNSLASNETAVLIDDNDKVRNGWNLGKTINPTTENIIEALKKL